MRFVFVSLFFTFFGFSATRVQTTWTAGSGYPGPSSSWGNRFFEAENNISYTSEGKLLMLTPLPPSEHIVDDSFSRAYCVYASDIDSDGDLDILGAAEWADEISWWENTSDTSPGLFWTKHTIDGSFNNARSVCSFDADGDGDSDVLGAGYSFGGTITLWRNLDGTGNQWSEQILSDSSSTSICYSDIDGDGDTDILGTSPYYITWWENGDGSGENWTKHDIYRYIGCSSVYSTDIDGDGDYDVLGAARLPGYIRWWENSNGLGTSWTMHFLDEDFIGVKSVYSADIDGDGDCDVLGAAETDNDIAWWENVDGTGTSWIKHTIDSNYLKAVSVFSIDLDSDGDYDVLGAGNYANEITWWENIDGSGTTWIEHTVCGDFRFARSVYSADINSDGHFDILGACEIEDTIAWWDITDYSLTGSLESSILDAGNVVQWSLFQSNSLQPPGTSVGFQFRSSVDHYDMGDWSDTIYSSDTTLVGILADSTRYLQYRTILKWTDLLPVPAPELYDVSFNYTTFSDIQDDYSSGFASWSLNASENPSHGIFSALVLVAEAGSVDLSIYDVSGRVVAQTSQELPAGTHSANFAGLAEGVYFCTMRAGEFFATERIVILE